MYDEVIKLLDFLVSYCGSDACDNCTIKNTCRIKVTAESECLSRSVSLSRADFMKIVQNRKKEIAEHDVSA